MIGRNVSGGPAANADHLTDENIENIGGHQGIAAHFVMGYAPILFRYYNLGIGLCQLKGTRRGALGYSGAVEIAALRGGYVGYGWAGGLAPAVGTGA